LRQFSQGAIQTSSGPLDAAIQGDGFFVVRDPSGASLYSRGGHLQVDLSGHLTTSTGEKLQGWTNLNATGVVDTNAPLSDIVVPVGTLKPPITTKNISMDLNLNAAAAAGAVFSNSIEVFDSLGNSHIVKVQFTKSATAESVGLRDHGSERGRGYPVSVQEQVTFDATGGWRLRRPGIHRR
jgi:flagellar hook protein FlgE